MGSPESEAAVLTVLSDVAPDGSYVATLQITEDRAITLDHERAIGYALAVILAAQAADYDAAILRQAAAMGVDTATAAPLLVEVRNRRPHPPGEVTAPLRFASIVNAQSQPWVQIYLDGEQFGCLTPADACGHALSVLQALVGADLDTVFRDSMVEVMGLADHVARAMVGDLAQHWPDVGEQP